MREALYYHRPVLSQGEAILKDLLPEGGIVLDETIFYPEGGGQPGDLGTLGGLPLVSVTEEGGRVVHRLAVPLPGNLRPGARVALVLDLERRQDHTEQHSGQHLLSATCLRLLGAPTRSFHLGPERCTIDLATALPGPADLDALEAEVNRLIDLDLPLATHLCPPGRVEDYPLRRIPPADAAVLRIVEIDGLDYTPCCGTHVGSTGELRLLLLLGAEKYKGDLIRLHFAVGGRAVALARASARAGREAARLLGVALGEVPAEAGRLLERAKKGQAERRGLVRERARLEARLGAVALEAGAPARLDLPGRDMEAALESAKAYAELGHPVLIVLPDETTICAAAPAGGPDLAALLGPLAAARGGRGGGSPSFYRATFQNSYEMGEFLADMANFPHI